MLTFKLVELTSKVQEQIVFQKNQAASEKSSEKGLTLCWQLVYQKSGRLCVGNIQLQKNQDS